MRGCALLLAVLVVTSGCSGLGGEGTVPEGAAPEGVEPGTDIDEVVESWEEERRANRPVGVAASLSASGPYRVRADSEPLRAAELAAPLELAPAPVFPSEEPLLLFENATVDGREGTLLVRGAGIEVTDGSLRDLPVEAARGGEGVGLGIAARETARQGPDHGNDTVSEVTTFGEDVALTADGLRLTNHSAAVLFVGNESHRLSGAVTVSAEGLWWARNSTVRTDRARLETERFSVVAPEATATVRAEDRTVSDASAVFAQNATLVVGPEEVRTDSARVRQALTADGPAFDARLQVLPTRVTVPVERGRATWVKVYYRETTYVGDAVFADVSVSGPGAAYVEVPLERAPPPIMGALVALANSSAPVPLRAAGVIALAPAAALELVAVAVDCIVTDCPEQHPYPTWAYAGTVDRFYYRVDATGADPGTYNATIRVEGENYPPVEIPVTVRVTENRTATAGS